MVQFAAGYSLVPFDDAEEGNLFFHSTNSTVPANGHGSCPMGAWLGKCMPPVAWLEYVLAQSLSVTVAGRTPINPMRSRCQESDVSCHASSAEHAFSFRKSSNKLEFLLEHLVGFGPARKLLHNANIYRVLYSTKGSKLIPIGLENSKDNPMVVSSAADHLTDD